MSGNASNMNMFNQMNMMNQNFMNMQNMNNLNFFNNMNNNPFINNMNNNPVINNMNNNPFINNMNNNPFINNIPYNNNFNNKFNNNNFNNNNFNNFYNNFNNNFIGNQKFLLMQQLFNNFQFEDPYELQKQIGRGLNNNQPYESNVSGGNQVPSFFKESSGDINYQNDDPNIVNIFFIMMQGNRHIRKFKADDKIGDVLEKFVQSFGLLTKSLESIYFLHNAVNLNNLNQQKTLKELHITNASRINVIDMKNIIGS